MIFSTKIWKTCRSDCKKCWKMVVTWILKPLAWLRKKDNSLHIISVKEVLLLMCSVFKRKVTFNSFSVSFWQFFHKGPKTNFKMYRHMDPGGKMDAAQIIKVRWWLRILQLKTENGHLKTTICFWTGLVTVDQAFF